MKQLNVKKLVLLNLPYFLLGLFATNLGEAWRLATGADASAKMLSFFSTLPVALGSWWPSLHPLDLAVGLCCGAGLRLAVYLKGKNAKKYRHNVEYGSARWGTHDDIAPYIDPVFQNNVILTQTERLTMSSRPKNPKYARNKNVLVIGGSGSGKGPAGRCLCDAAQERLHHGAGDFPADLPAAQHYVLLLHDGAEHRFDDFRHHLPFG